MERLLKVATPPAALRVTAPLKVPLPALLLIDTVTEELSVVTRLPNESSTCTVTAGLIETPATVEVGCVPMASLLAAAGVILNVPEVAPVSELGLVSAAVRV